MQIAATVASAVVIGAAGVRMVTAWARLALAKMGRADRKCFLDKIIFDSASYFLGAGISCRSSTAGEAAHGNIATLLKKVGGYSGQSQGDQADCDSD